MSKLLVLLHFEQQLSLLFLHLHEGSYLHGEQEHKRQEYPGQRHRVHIDQEAFLVPALVRRIFDPVHECNDLAAVGDEKYDELELDKARLCLRLLEHEDVQLANQVYTRAEVD